MAGVGFLGHTVTFNSVAITHVTAFAVNTQGNSATQIVADSAAALSLTLPAIKSITFSFAVPASGAATLLDALEVDEVGALVVVLKTGIGGTTVATWTASDSLSSSQGVSVVANAGGFVIASCTISTNGGAWA